MKYIICQNILPSLEQETEYINAMLHGDSAMESFHLNEVGDKTSELSVKQIESMITKLDASIYNWQHDLSKAMSDTVKKVFSGNESMIKCLNHDMSMLNKEKSACMKSLKTPGLTTEVEEKLNQQYNEILDSLEHTKTLLVQYRTALYITNDVSVAVDKAMQMAVNYGNIIIKSYNQYMAMVDKRNEALFKKLPFNEDDFIHKLNALIDSLDKYGQVNSELQHIQDEFDRICTTQIYGKEVSSDPVFGTKFEFSKTVTMNEQYDIYNKMTDKFHDRLKVLSKELTKAKKNKPGAESYRCIVTETLFILIISKRLSMASTMYLTPVLSLLDSYNS